ncbi:MAG TPA: hypothetical protein VN238_20340, partial [Solirubrobacteraceae bacterium]|nr:hypothetical protein [Solirubrobacteraceae bacterium]
MAADRDGMTSKPAVLTATLLALVAAAPASAQSGPPTDITPVVQPAYATYGIWTGPFTGKPSKFDASVQNTTAAKGDFAYTWTSSDGTVPVPVATDPTGATVEFTFPTTGPREVTVSVTGPNGFADTFTSTVEVKDEPPQPNYDGWKPAVTVTNVTTTANVAPHPYAPIPVRPAPVAEPAVAPVARFGKLATKVARNGRLAVPVSCDAVAGDACSAQVVVRTARPVKLGGG